MNLCEFKQEISAKLKFIIGKDQFAYRTGSNTTMAISKCQHQWLKWLEDEDVDFIRVISFDFSKAFDSVPHYILCEKLKQTWLNLLGMILEDDPCNWDMQVDNLLSKAASRLYSLRVCRLYGYTKENLNILCEFLILSLFYTMELKSGDLRYGTNICNALINSFGALTNLDTP